MQLFQCNEVPVPSEREKKKARENTFVIEIRHLKDISPHGWASQCSNSYDMRYWRALWQSVPHVQRIGQKRREEICTASLRCAACAHTAGCTAAVIHTVGPLQSRTVPSTRTPAKLWAGVEQRRKEVWARESFYPVLSPRSLCHCRYPRILHKSQCASLPCVCSHVLPL